MVTAKDFGRTLGKAAVVTLATPFAVAGVVPVAIASVVLANAPNASRFWRLHAEIGADLTQIRAIMDDPQHVHHAYCLRQVTKYLNPAWPVQVKNKVTKLAEFFDKTGQATEGSKKWSFSGMEPPTAGAKMFFSFGHSPRNGRLDKSDDFIRIAPKAFCLTDKVLAGVMLHEATHFENGTVDHAYDTNCWFGHEELKELSPDKRFENADNWRIFYQKMRMKLRP